MNSLERNKIEFLLRYNPVGGWYQGSIINPSKLEERAVNEAITKAINASVQRNKVYPENASKEEKQKFRLEWKEILFGLVQKYKGRVVKEADYFDEVSFLLESMQGNPFFNASHAQKSISVLFKHLWCIGLTDEPEFCPIDRFTIEAVWKSLKLNGKRPNWTKILTIESLQKILDKAKDASKQSELTVAKWELQMFNK